MSKVRTPEPEGPNLCKYCDRPVRSLGLCNHHYHKHNKYGDALAPRPKRASPARDWFLKALEYEGDECQLSPFCKSKDGYARFEIDGKLVFGSRYACEVAHGPPPSINHDAAHTCRNGRNGCVTKRHVIWKTHKENISDKWDHGTMLVGERHHRAKLTEPQVREIRGLRNAIPRKAMANKFGVGVSTIDNILDGVTWRHV